jgi:copper chaperone CopZ
MFKNLKSICGILFAIIFVFALSFSTLQACEDDANCNEPCGSKKCEIKNNNECCLAKKSKQLSASESDKAEGIAQNADDIVLNIKGMTCGGCANRVKDALIKCAGVADVHVSHKDGKAVVQVEKGKVNTQNLIEAVEKVGFSASEA